MNNSNSYSNIAPVGNSSGMQISGDTYQLPNPYVMKATNVSRRQQLTYNAKLQAIADGKYGKLEESKIPASPGVYEGGKYS